MGLALVCSNKPRPSVQKGAKGHQFWKRDVHHIADGRKTLCGKSAAEWLMIPCVAINPDDLNLCVRCKTAFVAQAPEGARQDD